MQAVLTTRVSVPWSPELAWVKKALTVTSKPSSPLGTPSTLEMYEIKDELLHMPKVWALDNRTKLGINTVIDEQFAGVQLTEEDTKLSLPAGLRPHQVLAADAIVKAFRVEPLGGGAMLILPCGCGKSITALAVMHRMAVKTLIIVNTSVLASQWLEVITRCVPGARVGLIQQSKYQVAGMTHVVAVAHTVAGERYDFKDAGFGMVAIDECLPYTQRVQTSDGPRTIGSLYEQFWKKDSKLPMVPSLNEDTGEIELKRITHAFKKTRSTVLHIKYSANILKCTDNHRILTLDGYKTAAELKIGEILISNLDESDLRQSAAARVLSEDQYQIVLGSFLGDGYIHRLPSGRFRLKVIHGEKQTEYCTWKAQMFGCDVQVIEKNGYAQTPAVRFTSKMFDLHPSRQFPQTKTLCPQWVLDDLDARGLAIWWMDDGTLSREGVSGRLSTCSFDNDSHMRILQKLDSMGIEAQIIKERQHQSIQMNEDGIMALLKLIAPYAHSDSNTFQHQGQDGYIRCRHDRKRYIGELLPLDLDTDMHHWDSRVPSFGTVRVEKITCKENTRSGGNAVFDLEIEDNHNFVACGQGGVGPIVHNCHRVCCPTLSKCITKAGARWRLGLTATPVRADGFDAFLDSAIGPIAFQMKRENPEELKVYNISLDQGPCTMHVVRAKGGISTPCIAKIVNDMEGAEPRAQERQEVAAGWLRLSASKGRHILVVADRISLLENLADRVKDELHVAFLIGKTKAKDRETAREATVIFASYACAAEGLDIEILDTLLLLTPRSGNNVITQSVGRLLRNGGRTPIVIDMVDKLSVFESMYKKRCKVYRELGAQITRFDEHFNKL